MRRVGLVRRVVAGDAYRKTRLHDEKGNLLPPREFTKLPQHVGELAIRHATGRLPRRPWLASNLIPVLNSLLQPEWSVVEYGSGMSTVWLAARVRQLHSIEHDPDWYARIRRLVHGIRYDLRDRSSYVDLSDHDDATLDFVLVDGVRRADCVREALRTVRPGGWICLDNSDKDAIGGAMRDAERVLLAGTSWHRFFTGLTPGFVNVQQSLLARVAPADPAGGKNI